VNTNNIILTKTTGNVGIGTTDPQQKLDVQGNIKVSGNINNVTSEQIAFLEGVSSSIQTQLNNKISSQWTTGTDLIYYDTGTVGIGKTDPNTSYKLDITGDAYVVGNVYATDDVVSSFSDIRLKHVISEIQNPIEKIMNIKTFKYTSNDVAKLHGINDSKVNIGVSAQDIQAVLPEIVTLAPFDTIIQNGEKVSKSGENFLTVSYERLVPLLIECIKELKKEIDEIKRNF
jgi:hypothetical protein